MVERISHSRYWKESVIFVIEDDAANGPDHVDAHRTVALVAGPYVRRAARWTAACTRTPSVLRTIELMLGLPPMSQFDAAARPHGRRRSPRRRTSRRSRTGPARLDLDETNVAGACGQDRCGPHGLPASPTRSRPTS